MISAAIVLAVASVVSIVVLLALAGELACRAYDTKNPNRIP